jgi:hypothetical protein
MRRESTGSLSIPATSSSVKALLTTPLRENPKRRRKTLRKSSGKGLRGSRTESLMAILASTPVMSGTSENGTLPSHFMTSMTASIRSWRRVISSMSSMGRSFPRASLQKGVEENWSITSLSLR